jgi:hypothetical protein
MSPHAHKFIYKPNGLEVKCLGCLAVRPTRKFVGNILERGLFTDMPYDWFTLMLREYINTKF